VGVARLLFSSGVFAMNASKVCSMLSFLAGMAMVPAGHAAQVSGNLVSLSVSVPGLPSLVSTVELAQPGFTGNLSISAYGSLSSITSISGSIREDYHAVHLDAEGGLSSVMYYPLSIFSFSGRDPSSSYDYATRTLSLHDVETSFSSSGASPFCTGSIAICGAVYEKYPKLGLLDLVLVFDRDLNNVTGTATFSHTLANGTVISGQYNFTGSPSVEITPAPVPAAGWMLGSSLVGLMGAVVRRRRLGN